jgi:hypothetical protein
LGVSWKVQIDRRKLWFEVRGALTNIVLVGLLALFVPSLHAPLEEFVVCAALSLGGVVLVGAIHLVYAAIHMAAICLTALRPTRPTNTAQILAPSGTGGRGLRSSTAALSRWRAFPSPRDDPDGLVGTRRSESIPSGALSSHVLERQLPCFVEGRYEQRHGCKPLMPVSCGKCARAGDEPRSRARDIPAGSRTRCCWRCPLRADRSLLHFLQPQSARARGRRDPSMDGCCYVPSGESVAAGIRGHGHDRGCDRCPRQEDRAL